MGTGLARSVSCLAWFIWSWDTVVVLAWPGTNHRPQVLSTITPAVWGQVTVGWHKMKFVRRPVLGVSVVYETKDRGWEVVLIQYKTWRILWGREAEGWCADVMMTVSGWVYFKYFYTDCFDCWMHMCFFFSFQPDLHVWKQDRKGCI